MKNQKKFQSKAGLMVLMLLVVGCVKDKPTKEVLKYQVESKDVIDESADYLYVPSVVTSPRSQAATRPHWQGEAKLVRLKLAENALRIYEVDADSRFRENVNNQKPVLEIPITHKDFKCAEDSYGDCTNQEQENSEVTWDKKRYFVPDFNKVSYQEVNFLPIEITNLFGNCYQELATEFVGYKLEKEAINFEVEKTFKSNINCLSYLESLSDISFSVRYHYSVTRLDRLASADYKAFSYSRAEEVTFGYFTTREHFLDVDNNDTEGSEKFYLNRWNPTKKITYHMNAPFNKPENKVLKQATIDAVKSINRSLEQTGSEVRIDLKDPVEGMQVGDLRNNMIVMVEDPQNSGIIGYGPSVTNPLTGEIVNARTVMYLGNIKAFLKWTYDEVIEAKLEELQLEAAKLAEQVTEVSGSASEQGQSKPAIRLVQNKASKSQQLISEVNHLSHGHNHGGDTSQRRLVVDRQLSEKKLRQLSVDRQDLTKISGDMRQRLEILSKYNAYPGELFNFHSAIEAQIDDLLKETQLKPWLQLTEVEKRKVIDTLLPYVWVPTLVHELGHNLGLRHNFAGSEDKANFYSKDELAEMGAKKEFKYSSVMDYAYRSTNELPVMGKYDIAALRFAYAEKMELASGELITVDEFRKTQGVELKPYEFCTDEHVAVNPTCNRFDEGTNLVEITAHFIDAYERRYQRSNHRNGRRNFSLLGDMSQLMFLENMMMEMRLSFERMETIKNRFDLPTDHPLWEQIPFLKELKISTLIGGLVMMDIIKTPDVHCAVSLAADPTQVLAIVPLQMLSTEAVTCFDSENVQLNPQYIIVAEGGKSFQSKKDPRNGNPYVDQIDVRGIWLDKLVAAKYLLKRELGSSIFDQYTENYLHVPELKPLIQETISQVVKDEVQGIMNLRTIFGTPAQVQLQYGLADQHLLLKPLSTATRLFLKLPNRNAQFHHELLQVVAREVPSRLHEDEVRDVLDSVSVRTVLPQNGRKEKEYKVLRVGTERFFALPENSLATELITNVEIIDELSKYDPEKLAEALSAKEEPQGDDQADGAEQEPVKPSAEQEVIARIGREAVEKFLADGFKSRSYYLATLREMARTTEAGAEERGVLSDLIDELAKEIRE